MHRLACPADLHHRGVVHELDLGLLLGAWEGRGEARTIASMRRAVTIVTPPVRAGGRSSRGMRVQPGQLVMLVVPVMLVALAACVTRQPPDVQFRNSRSRVAPPRVSESAWPRRYEPREVFDEGCEVVLVGSPRGSPPEERTPLGGAGVGTLWRIDVEELAEAKDLERLRRERGFREWLVFQTYLGWYETTLALPTQQAAKRAGPAQRAHADAGTSMRLVEISETSFAIYEPKSTPRGLVVQLTNLAGNTDWERAITEEFRLRGWAVLSTFVPDGWALDECLELDAKDDPATLGVRLAAAIDDRFAEWAYGVEAVLEYMRTAYPEIPQSPLVAVGSSAGAIAVPAVAARLSQPFEATVVVGGGVNALSILRNTTLAATPLRLCWDDDRRPSDAQWEAIERVYLEHSQLDGLKTATYLRDHPVLILQGAHDRIVDAACGDALWEVLGRPERWSYQAGHLGLFFFWLPMETAKIADWVDANVGGG